MLFVGLICLIFFGYQFLNRYFGKKGYCAIVTIAFAVIAGMRGATVGTDTLGYIASFNRANIFSWNGVVGIFKEREPLFYLFENIVSSWIGNYTIYFCVIAFFYCGVVSWLIYKYSELPVISYLLFLSMGYFYFSMAGVRQTIAMAFLGIALGRLIERQYWRYMFWVVIACGFHITSLLFAVTMLLFFIPLNRIYLIVITVFSVLMMRYRDVLWITMVDFIWGDERNYTKEYGGTSTLILLAFIGLCVAVVYPRIFSNGKKVCKANREKHSITTSLEVDRLFYKMLLFSIPLQIMAVSQANAFRLAMIYHFTCIFLLPNTICKLSNSKSRMVAYLVVGMCLLVQFFAFTYYTADIVPYKFYWQ